MRSPSSLARLSLGLLLAGCGAAPAAPTEPPKLAEPAPSLPAVPFFRASFVRAPDHVTLDGDLGEWPPLEPDELGVAVTGRALHVVARLTAGAWLGIHASPPQIPSIGFVHRGESIDAVECEHETLAGPEGTTMQGKPNPPEVVAACQADLQRYADLTASFTARFTRVLRVDREGVRLATGAKLAPIDGAKVVVKPQGGEVLVEAELPLTALPRVAEAPLSSLALVVLPALGSETAPAELPDVAEWPIVELPEPVSFEPWPSLRAHALARQTSRQGPAFHDLHRQGRGQSYQPGDAASVESLVYGGSFMVVGPKVEPLYTKLATFGDLEVGKVPSAPEDAGATRESLAVFDKGKLVEVFEVAGEAEGAVERGGELHVLSYSPALSNSADGRHEAARWSVIAVRSDGTHHEIELDQPLPVAQNWPLSWHVVARLPGQDLDGFGVRGEDHGRLFELTWRWNAARGRYVGKRRNLPSPRKVKGKRG